jgi:predicted nucleic acid-binding protein
MAEALILDSEALNALAHPTERGALAERARAILTAAYERRALVRVPAPVLAEVCRGPRFDAAVNHILDNNGISVFDVTRDVAQRAGGLLAKAKLASEHAVDAFVVSTALEFDSAVIATGDPKDIKRLLGSNRKVRVFAL